MIQKLLLTLFIFFLLIAGFFHSISAITQDLGRHLLTGQIILQTHSVPKVNLFSYTYPNFSFINHHWFSEVIFYLTNDVVGFNGLLILTILTVTAAFAFVYFYALKKGNIFAVTIISILSLRVLFERTDVRPELFSFLFLSIFIVILYKYREHYTRWIFLLPFLELLWVNMHIYFPIGIAVIGLFLIDHFSHVMLNSFQHLNHQEPRSRNKFGMTKKGTILIAIFIVSTLATLLNPNGLEGALYPFRVFNNYGYTIEENQTVFFLWNYFHGKTTILYFFIASSLLFLSLLITIKKTRPVDWLLAIFFTYLAANAERNFPLFVFGTFIPFTNSLSIIFNTIRSQPTRTIVLTFILLAILIWNINDVIQLRGFGFGVESGAKAGTDFFLTNNLKGPIFNNFDIGSYLEYRLYPKEKVFIDGRPEAYPASFIQNTYIPMQIDKHVFDTMTKKYTLNTIFFSYTDQTPWAITFLKQIVQDKTWTMVYLDDYVIIFVKNNNKNPDSKTQVVINENNMQSLLRLAYFFNTVGWQNQEMSIYQQILTLNPNYCPALYNLYLILNQKNDPLAPVYTQRLQQTCK